MLNVIYTGCHNKVRSTRTYLRCRYAECHCAECRGATKTYLKTLRDYDKNVTKNLIPS